MTDGRTAARQSHRFISRSILRSRYPRITDWPSSDVDLFELKRTRTSQSLAGRVRTVGAYRVTRASRRLRCHGLFRSTDDSMMDGDWALSLARRQSTLCYAHVHPRYLALRYACVDIRAVISCCEHRSRKSVSRHTFHSSRIARNANLRVYYAQSLFLPIKIIPLPVADYFWGPRDCESPKLSILILNAPRFACTLQNFKIKLSNVTHATDHLHQ